MQFFPHKTSTNTTATAVSASIALTGSFIGNFSAIEINRVLTASIALNITGSRGTDGTSVAVIGPTGPQGARGDTGFRGRNIFLLSSSWEATPGGCVGGTEICSGSYILYPAGPGTQCSLAGRASAYNTNYGNLIPVTDTSANGSILFTGAGGFPSDPICTTVVANAAVHNGSVIFYTDGAGVISTEICTDPEPVPTGECYTVTNNDVSTTISWTDVNGAARTGTLENGQTTYICSLTLPDSVPAGADITVTGCDSPCTNVCTSLPCSGISMCPC